MRIEKKHYDAFNIWFEKTEEGHTSTQSMALTADEMGVTERTIQNWAKEMKWQEKAEQRRAEIQKELEKKQNRTLAQNKKKYLDILHKLLYEYVEQGLPAKIESVRDLEIILKNSLLLQDAPTENVKQNNTSVNYDVDATNMFDKDRMREILEKEEASEVELLDLPEKEKE